MREYLDKDIILAREMENDERAIHLYYCAELGFYVAWGFSAFFASHIVEPVTSYSDMQMPVVLLRRSDLPELRRMADGPSGDYDDYVRFEMYREIPLWMGTAGGSRG